MVNGTLFYQRIYHKDFYIISKTIVSTFFNLQFRKYIEQIYISDYQKVILFYLSFLKFLTLNLVTNKKRHRKIYFGEIYKFIQRHFNHLEEKRKFLFKDIEKQSYLCLLYNKIKKLYCQLVKIKYC